MKAKFELGNCRGAEGGARWHEWNKPNRGQAVDDGTIRPISNTDGYGIITSDHIRVNGGWVKVDEVRRYARLIRDIKHTLTEKPELSSDEKSYYKY